MACSGDGRGTGQSSSSAEADRTPLDAHREYERLNPGPRDAERNNAVDGTGAGLPGGSDEDLNRLRTRERHWRDQPSFAPLLGLTILIVEDLFILAAHTAHVLRSAGAEVLGPTASVDKALQLAIARKPDAALLNIDLNGRSSFDLAAALLSRDIPVLFLSGYEDFAVPEPFRHVSKVGKPYADRELVTAVTRLLADLRPKPVTRA